ncbi:MAG TPA: hypothetical protein VNO55_30025 [Polyangia bacterium]|nr:hypothetical protein [Polyangia bacterium]
MARPDVGAERPTLVRRLMDGARRLGGAALDPQLVSILDDGLAATTS